MSNTIITPPPLTQQVVVGKGFVNRIWGTWFSLLYSKLGGANVGSLFLTARMDDVSVLNTLFIPVPVNCNLLEVYCTVQGSVTGADEVININNNAGSTLGTLTIPLLSPAGTVVSKSFTNNNAFVKGTNIRLTSQGLSGGSVNGLFTIIFNY